MGEDCSDYSKWGLNACGWKVWEAITKHGGISFESQDGTIMKSPRKYPFSLRRMVLTFAIVCAMYICSVCLKQTSSDLHPKIVHVDNAKSLCPSTEVGLWRSQSDNVHYPEPTNYSREECACNPVRFFAILSTQRSGSGWFETLLNSHLNVSSNGEIFSLLERRKNMSAITRTLDKVYNLDWFSSAAKNECTAAVGFKWMLNQGLMDHHKGIAEYFQRRGVSSIFLFRRNLLRRMVSILANAHDRSYKLLNGTHKSHVHSKGEAAILASYKPKIDIGSLVPDLKQMEQSALDALNYFKDNRHIILFYEDLIQNRTKLIEVLKFLQVPKQKLVSRQVKIHVKPLHEQIDNWDAVHDTLKGTNYESFLNADYQM